MTPLPPFRERVLAALPGLAGEPWHPLSGGRTNRLWRLGEVVIKAYNPAATSPLFPNDAKAEARALGAFGRSGVAPRLAAAGTDWVAYRFVQGQAWRTGTEGVAALLHRLHTSAPVEFRPLASGSAAVLAQAHRILAECRGRIGPPPPAPEVPPAPVAQPLHGDAVPGNIIDGPLGLTLIDWQCPALGDPAEDLGLFLSPAMQFLYRGRILAPQERTAFLAAYPDREAVARCLALEPLFRWRMAAHCLWKAERGAADYAPAMTLELT